MSLRWYAHDLDAYDRDTGSLTMLQTGAYRLLLDGIYKTGKPLPPELVAVHIIARAHSKLDKAAVSLVLGRYFTLKSDGWHNGRADEELEKAGDISQKRSNAGANGAAKRKQKHEQPDSNRQASADTTTTTNTSLEPDGSKQKGAGAPFVLPDWVPKPAWENFIEVRKRAKANPTDRAKVLLIDKLEKLKEQGFSPQECIDAAVENSWKSFYPPPSQRLVNGSGNRPTAHENLQEGTALALKRLGAG